MFNIDNKNWEKGLPAVSEMDTNRTLHLNIYTEIKEQQIYKGHRKYIDLTSTKK